MLALLVALALGATPATRPAHIELAELRAQVKRLQKENAELRAKLEALQPRPDDKSKEERSVRSLLTAARSGRIDAKRGTDQGVSIEGVTYFSSMAAKARKVKELQEEASRLERRQSRPETAVIYTNDIRDGAVGEIANFAKPGYVVSGQVVQVIDDNAMLVKISRTNIVLWVETATDQYADGSEFDFDGVWRVDGRKQYENATGTTSTVWRLRR